MNDLHYFISLCGLIITLGSAYMTLRKVNHSIKKDREANEAKILQQAKEEDSALRAKLESKIKALEVSSANMKESFDKDLAHLKETHSGQIANLGEKIEALRDELRGQHAQMVELLSKLIDR